MKATSSFLLALFLAVGCCLLTVPAAGQGTQASQSASAPAAPEKTSIWSKLWKKKSPPQAPVQAQPPAAAPPQVAPQGASGERKPRLRLNLPKFKKPDFSKIRIPKPKLPKVSVPKVNVPKVKMPNLRVPKVNWPFGRGERQANRQTVQDYPQGVRNPQLGGAYGVVRKDNVKFYELGPSQPFGPDEVLSSGTLVTIRSNDRSWAYVTLRDGRSGYVGLDQVRLASAKEAPKTFSRPTRTASQSLVADSALTPPSEVAPPALPTAAADLSEPAGLEANPLLDLGGSLAEGDPVGLEVLPEAPVDSPEVLFDPLLEPLEPLVPEGQGGPAPFLDDPIPSIEEELRAIQEAKAKAAEEDDGGEPEDDEEGEEAATDEDEA